MRKERWFRIICGANHFNKIECFPIREFKKQAEMHAIASEMKLQVFFSNRNTRPLLT
jgi:hypothetical protein